MGDKMNIDKEFICINCPLGCRVRIEGNLNNPESFKVTGNTCSKGKEYVLSEVTAPKRMVTSSILVSGGSKAVVSVKTASAIPKEKIFDVMSAITDKKVIAPIKIGDKLIEDVCETGVDIVATSNVKKIS